MEHACPGFKSGFKLELGWSLEDKGDGWYMYNQKGERSAGQYRFCPSCGQKLSEDLKSGVKG